MVKLGVNIDHIATLRQARKTGMPDLLTAAKICVQSGADSITVHLREDRRHIQDNDVIQLRNKLDIKLNLEMSIAQDIVKFALKIKPDEVCLVPEKRQELTTEGGLNAIKYSNRLKDVIKELQKAGIKVSLFIDPDRNQVMQSKLIGADMVELHTGCYAGAKSEFLRKKELNKLTAAAQQVVKSGLALNAGHGLDYSNVVQVAKISRMNTLNIGFSIIAKSVFIGLSESVRQMKILIN